jgi:hypothetical protein
MQKMLEAIDSPSKAVPIMSRIPASETAEATAIQMAREHLGEYLDQSRPLILHEEMSLHVIEELLFGSDRTLLESQLLNDYFRIFYHLDHDAIKLSPYYKLKKYFLSTDCNKGFDGTSLDRDDIHIVDNLQNRKVKELRHAGKYDYIEGEQFGAFQDSFTNKTLELLRETIPDLIIEDPPIAEDKINWDLLSTQMSSEVFDVCSEPYYLTKYRRLFAGVIQYGWAKTYTCFVRKDTELFSKIIGTSGIDGERRIATVFRALHNLCPQLEIGLMGETAATDESSKHISPFLHGKALHFLKDAEGLFNWLKGGDSEKQIVICDHTLAAKMYKLSLKDEEAVPYAFARNLGTNLAEEELAFGFSEDIPVGILYPLGDRKWRHLLNLSCFEVLNKNSWAGIAQELDNSGVVPFTWEQLETQLVLGMTPMEASALISPPE